MKADFKMMLAMALSAGLSSSPLQIEPENSEYKPKRRYPSVKRHQGKKEMARRAKQIKVEFSE